MPTQNELRQRKSQKKPPASEAEPDPEPPLHTFITTLQRHLMTALMFLQIPLIGALSAASLSNTPAAVLLFMLTFFAVFLSLVLVYMSLLRQPDVTPVPLRAVHRPDGTVSAPAPLTAHEHDKSIANHFSLELPALGLAAAWFFLWSQLRFVVLVYAAYIAYRLLYHPLFRIHLWKEAPCPEFERPFGGVPLYGGASSEGDVRSVAGKAAFEEALEGAGEKLVFVAFSATWCKPCRTAVPLIQRLAEEFRETVVFFSVDVDHSQDVAAQHGIGSVPSFLFFQGGSKVEMVVGAVEASLREAIQRHLGM